jgi:hypothetical protein
MPGQYGQQGTFDDVSEDSVAQFLIRQAIGSLRTCIPVQVKKVTGGAVGAPPVVDVLPLVNLMDGQGNASSHGTISGVPVVRMQGGKNAIIVDPVVDDIGWLMVADRDISAVKANKGDRSNPGSFRRHNLADGVYFGGILNPADPTQYVQFTKDGLKIVDKNSNIIELKDGEIDITATKVRLNGNLEVHGDITATGSVTAGQGSGDQIGLQSHKHPTAASGPPSSPTPGT